MNGDLIDVETPAGFGYRLLAFIADGIILTLVSTLLRALNLSSLDLIVDVAYFWLSRRFGGFTVRRYCRITMDSLPTKSSARRLRAKALGTR